MNARKVKGEGERVANADEVWQGTYSVDQPASQSVCQSVGRSGSQPVSQTVKSVTFYFFSWRMPRNTSAQCNTTTLGAKVSAGRQLRPKKHEWCACAGGSGSLIGKGGKLRPALASYNTSGLLACLLAWLNEDSLLFLLFCLFLVECQRFLFF